MMKTASAVKRYGKNPLFKTTDVPYKATLIYNAGVARYGGKYVMVFRNDMFEDDRMGST